MAVTQTGVILAKHLGTGFSIDEAGKKINVNFPARYDDTILAGRVTVLEGRRDKYVTSVIPSRSGNTITLKYTFSDGTNTSVSFDDQDTVTLGYDDTSVRNRLTALEGKADNDTKYTAGDGLQLSGTKFSAKVDGTTIQSTGGTLSVVAKAYTVRDMFGDSVSVNVA